MLSSACIYARITSARLCSKPELVPFIRDCTPSRWTLYYCGSIQSPSKDTTQLITFQYHTLLHNPPTSPLTNIKTVHTYIHNCHFFVTCVTNPPNDIIVFIVRRSGTQPPSGKPHTLSVFHKSSLDLKIVKHTNVLFKCKVYTVFRPQKHNREI